MLIVYVIVCVYTYIYIYIHNSICVIISRGGGSTQAWRKLSGTAGGSGSGSGWVSRCGQTLGAGEARPCRNGPSTSTLLGGVRGSATEGRFRKCGLTVFPESWPNKNKARVCNKTLESKKKTHCSNCPFYMDLLILSVPGSGWWPQRGKPKGNPPASKGKSTLLQREIHLTPKGNPPYSKEKSTLLQGEFHLTPSRARAELPAKRPQDAGRRALPRAWSGTLLLCVSLLALLLSLAFLSSS